MAARLHCGSVEINRRFLRKRPINWRSWGKLEIGLELDAVKFPRGRYQLRMRFGRTEGAVSKRRNNNFNRSFIRLILVKRNNNTSVSQHSSVVTLNRMLRSIKLNSKWFHVRLLYSGIQRTLRRQHYRIGLAAVSLCSRFKLNYGKWN